MRIRIEKRDSMRGLGRRGLFVLCAMLLGLGTQPLLACGGGGDESRVDEAMEEIQDEAEDAKEDIEDEIDDRM